MIFCWILCRTSVLEQKCHMEVNFPLVTPLTLQKRRCTTCYSSNSLTCVVVKSNPTKFPLNIFLPTSRKWCMQWNFLIVFMRGNLTVSRPRSFFLFPPTSYFYVYQANFDFDKDNLEELKDYIPGKFDSDSSRNPILVTTKARHLVAPPNHHLQPMMVAATLHLPPIGC